MNAALLGPDFAASLALIGLLGFRHGFDADHIAAVDGLTRARQWQGSYWAARRVGVQFAAGHGAMILAASLLLFGQSAALPAWLDGLGLAIATAFLLFIAASNLGHALNPSPQGQRPPGPLAALLMRAGARFGLHLHPALVGMAFAISFDSMAQAAFFAARGSQFSGMAAVVLMALVFCLGMCIADAANGALLAWFAVRSDRLARRASRWSSGFIGTIALATALAGLLREFQSGFAQAWDDAGLAVGLGLVAATSLAFALRIALQRRRGAGAQPLFTRRRPAP